MKWKRFLRAKSPLKVSTFSVSKIIRLGYFSDVKLNELPLSEQTIKAINELGFEKATEIQARAIPHIINGRDVLG